MVEKKTSAPTEPVSSSFKKLALMVEEAVAETRTDVVRDELLLLACLLFLGEHDCADESLLPMFQGLTTEAYRRTLEEIRKEAQRRNTVVDK